MDFKDVLGQKPGLTTPRDWNSRVGKKRTANERELTLIEEEKDIAFAFIAVHSRFSQEEWADLDRQE